MMRTGDQALNKAPFSALKEQEVPKRLRGTGSLQEENQEKHGV